MTVDILRAEAASVLEAQLGAVAVVIQTAKNVARETLAVSSPILEIQKTIVAEQKRLAGIQKQVADTTAALERYRSVPEVAAVLFILQQTEIMVTALAAYETAKAVVAALAIPDASTIAVVALNAAAEQAQALADTAMTGLVRLVAGSNE